MCRGERGDNARPGTVSAPAVASVQARVQALVSDLVVRGEERGLQVAVYHAGRLVVDCWAGIADPRTGRPVDGETLFPVFSVTKAITATAVHLLAEKGKLDYDTPIARSWPEFGEHGKAAITPRHVLTHTAGLPDLPLHLSPAVAYDWDAMCRLVAAASPRSVPGRQVAYHALTWGWILGELARRVDGRPFAQLVDEELCRPLGITSLFVGLPDSEAERAALLEGGSPVRGPIRAAIPLALEPTAAVFNRPEVRRAVIPATTGMVTARALARLFAGLLPGGVDGVRLWIPERLRTATALQTAGIDAMFGIRIRRSLGYLLGQPLSPMGARVTAFGHDGAGGAIAFGDPDYGLACAIVKNRLVPDNATARRIAQRIRHDLGIPEGTYADRLHAAYQQARRRARRAWRRG